MNYHVRVLYAMDEEALMALPTMYSITFDDGEVKEVWRLETVYSWLFWRIFDNYQNVKILYKHHANSVMKGKPANSGTHRKLCSAILESIVRSEGLWLPVQKEPLLERIYRVISDASNRLSILTARDVTSIDITDFVQIAHDPRISKLRDEAEEDPRKIKFAFENTIDIIETAPEFDENGLAKADLTVACHHNLTTAPHCKDRGSVPAGKSVFRHMRLRLGQYGFGGVGSQVRVAVTKKATKSQKCAKCEAT